MEHKDLLGRTGCDDGDVRGEHSYADEGSAVTAEKTRAKRKTYAAGAEGTQEVRAPQTAKAEPDAKNGAD